MRAGLRVVQPNAVDENERLAARAAAQREVGLHAPRAARADVDAGREREHIGDRSHGQRGDLLAGQHHHVASERLEQHVLRVAGDRDLFTEGLLPLR